MYLWSIKERLPVILGKAYASFFGNGRSPVSGLDSFSRIVRQYQPTLICLQEVYGSVHQQPAQFEELERKIGSAYKWFICGKGQEKRAIVVNSKVLNGCPAERLATSEGSPFSIAYKLLQPAAWIASVHLKYSNLAERARQLEELLQWADSKKEPVLLAGDFNTHASWASPEKKEAASQTFYLLQKSGFQDLSETVACTWRWGRYLPTAGRIKLDHFFGKGVRAVEKPVAVREHLRGWMDHLALYGPKFEVE